MKRLLSSLALISGLLAAPGTPAATISYSLADPALGAPGGYFFLGAPEGPGRFAALMDVKGYVESVITKPGSLTISIGVFSDGSSTLAKGGQFFTDLSPVASGMVMGDAQVELMTGADLPGANGFILVNTSKSFYLGASPPVTAGMHDLRTVLLHELTHALGFASFMKPDDKTSALTDFLQDSDPVTYAGLGELYSFYDGLLVDSMGKPLLLGGAANPEALPIGGAFVASPMAIAAYGGDLVPTAVIPFIDGDLTHLKGTVDSVMNPTLAEGTAERFWTAVDLGILADLGLLTTPIPEPAVLWLLLPGLLLVWRRVTTCSPCPGLRRPPAG